MVIGNKLKSLRAEKEISVLSIAEKLGVSESTYRKYENNDVSPTLDCVEKIAKVFDKEVTDILPLKNKFQNNHDNSVGINEGTITFLSEKLIQMYEDKITLLEEKVKNLEKK